MLRYSSEEFAQGSSANSSLHDVCVCVCDNKKSGGNKCHYDNQTRWRDCEVGLEG